MRRNDVASTSFRRPVPTRFLINQCQIITFLILKHDIIENSRIELRGIVLLVQVSGLLGGPKGMLAPPLKLLGGAWPPLAPPPPLPTPMFIFYMLCLICSSEASIVKPATDIAAKAAKLFIDSLKRKEAPDKAACHLGNTTKEDIMRWVDEKELDLLHHAIILNNPEAVQYLLKTGYFQVFCLI